MCCFDFGGLKCSMAFNLAAYRLGAWGPGGLNGGLGAVVEADVGVHGVSFQISPSLRIVALPSLRPKSLTPALYALRASARS